MRNRLILGLGLLVALLASAAPAAILIDNFDADGSRLDSSLSLANNAGWASDGWVSESSTITLLNSNLAFANAAYTETVSGKTVQANNTGRSGGRKLGEALTGTVWMSYLIKPYATNGLNTAIGLREGGANGTWPGYGTSVDGVAYTWDATGGVYNSGDATLSVGQTYLAVVRYSIADTGSSLTAWHFAAADVIPTTEAGLDALTGNLFSKSGLATLTKAEYVVYHGNALNADAVRISDSLGDAGLSEVLTAVPEPATMSVLALGGLLALRRRRR